MACHRAHSTAFSRSSRATSFFTAGFAGAALSAAHSSGETEKSASKAAEAKRYDLRVARLLPLRGQHAKQPPDRRWDNCSSTEQAARFCPLSP
ncbi:hypothetical protein MRX96_019028 [Rhipicephalus microplus]